MILARGAALRPDLIPELCSAFTMGETPNPRPQAPRPDVAVPGALLELAWADPRVPDRSPPRARRPHPAPQARAEDLPEDEIDLDPTLRPLPVLEKVVRRRCPRQRSPRAALVATALDARRVRYVLSAMPQWEGVGGGRLARILRQNAGAISAARRGRGPRPRLPRRRAGPSASSPSWSSPSPSPSAT